MGGDTGPDDAATKTAIRQDFARGDGFFSAPFPCASRLLADERVDLADFPGRDRVTLVRDLLAVLEADVRGFALSGAVFFSLSGPLEPSALPDWRASVQPDSSVALIVVDPASPAHGERAPIEVSFHADGGPFGAPNLLALLPLQGAPLRPETRYAAVVLRTVVDAEGRPLAPGAVLPALVTGPESATVPGLPPAAHAQYAEALSLLPGLGVPLDALAGVTVFRTGAPTRALHQAVAQVTSAALPEFSPWTLTETHADFCVLSASIDLPVFQAGAPPFMAPEAATNGAGGWVYTADGALAAQGHETARALLTLPRRDAPADGFPTALFVRTGGGGDRPLVDRGVRARPGGPPIAPGSGPAEDLARAGWAGLSVDGPHGGWRNVTEGDEQFLMFNLQNPRALRDNIRQSALELVLLAHALPAVALPPDGCDEAAGEAPPATLDLRSLVLMGHSMGATIAPLAMATSARFRAGVLSGAGGSWIANVIHKLRPLPVRRIAEAILGYRGRSLHPHDPVLTLLQWAGEAADPMVYAPEIRATRPDLHLLMFQGIADTYIFPPIANALSLPLGLDVLGPALDGEHPQTKDFEGIEAVLPISGGRVLPGPISANQVSEGGTRTAALVQHWEDGVEDGHEVMFQLEGPKHQYRCFLETLARGGPPTVVVAGARSDACE